MADPAQLYTEDDYRAFCRYRKSLERHGGYCRKVKRYIRANREYLEEIGWLDWAIEESDRPYIPDVKIPQWSARQVEAMRDRYEKRIRGQGLDDTKV